MACLGTLPIWIGSKSSRFLSWLSWERLCCGRSIEAATEAAYWCFATQASFFFHRWSLRHAGQCSDHSVPDSDSNLIVSVVRPVGTSLSNVGQWIMILGTAPHPCPQDARNPDSRRDRHPILKMNAEDHKFADQPIHQRHIPLGRLDI